MNTDTAVATKSTILVVDDDERALLAMEDILRSEAYDVILARSGEAALRHLLDRSDFALIILDVTMPGIDGFETLRMIKSREQSRTVPVCFLTFSSQDHRAFRAYSLGAVDFLVKPVEPRVLQAKAQVFVELHQANTKLAALNRTLQEQGKFLSEANRTLHRSEKRLRAALDEKELLLKEVHHRVKNNLQMISSLLSLQARYFTDPKVTDVFQECRSRIQAMALIHTKLYQSEDVSKVNFPGYMRSLAESLFRTYSVDQEAVLLRTEMEPIHFPIDTAIPMGLVINELVSNALKHAFPDGRRGTIFVRLCSTGKGNCVLEVADDGVGLPVGVDAANPRSMGMHIVSALVHQLEGRLDITRETGTSFSLTLPL